MPELLLGVLGSSLVMFVEQPKIVVPIYVNL